MIFKISLLTFLFFSSLHAASWSPFQNKSLNFAIPHHYAAKGPIISWYDYLFFSPLEERERELIDIIEQNTSAPIYCTKLTVGAITTNFCNPWTIAIFSKDGKLYLTHRRYKFFNTLNHMEVLKMNLGLEEYDTFEKIPLPFASKYLAEQLSPSDKLLLSFYYIYDYLINDSCSSYECEEEMRFKKKPTIIKNGEQFTSFNWIYRTLLTGCSQGGNCITAREVTYKVSSTEPTTWHSTACDTTFTNAWMGSLTWQKLQSQWVSGRKELSEIDQGVPRVIPNLPLP